MTSSLRRANASNFSAYFSNWSCSFRVCSVEARSAAYSRKTLGESQMSSTVSVLFLPLFFLLCCIVPCLRKALKLGRRFCVVWGESVRTGESQETNCGEENSGECPIHRNEVLDVLKTVIVGDGVCAYSKSGGGDPNVIQRDHRSGSAQLRSYLPVDAIDVLRRLNDTGKIIECFCSRQLEFCFSKEDSAYCDIRTPIPQR